MALRKGSVQKPVELDEFPEVPESIPRDRWDRPLIEPLDGGKATAYTRASTLGKAIEDTYHLSRWQQRSVAFGLSRRPDLVALAASIATNEGDDRAPLDEITEKAHEAAKGDKGANIGTALHKLSERRDAGEDLSYLPPELAEAMDAYAEQMRPFEVLAAETFVVCDPLQTAGSFDRVVRLRTDLEFHHAEMGRTIIPAGTVLVLDLKTGKLASAKYWGATYGVQQTVYACGQPYRHPVGRMSWESILGEGNRPSTEWALILHVPSDSPKDAGLVMVDLKIGAQLAELSVEVRQGRKAKGLLSDCFPVQVPAVPAQAEAPAAERPYDKCSLCNYDRHLCPGCGAPTRHERNEVASACSACELEFQIGKAESKEALDALWDQHQAIWTDGHTAAGLARMTELKANQAKPAQVTALDLIGKLRAAPDEAALNALWEANQDAWTDDCTRMVRARLAELGAKS